MSSIYDFVSGDTGSIYERTCKNDNDSTIINLTGATVKLNWKDSGGVKQTRTMTITSAVNGIVEYHFTATELFAGTMNLEVEITDSGGKIIKSLDLYPARVRGALS